MPGIHFHELVHVVQWNHLGLERFLLAYGTGLAEFGYALSPLEEMAPDLQRRFEAGRLGGSPISRDWPTDFGGAAGVKLVVRSGISEPPPKTGYGAKQVTAELRPNEIQDLADQLGELTKAAAGHELRFSIQIQVGTDKSPPDDVLEHMNKILGGIKKGMRLQ